MITDPGAQTLYKGFNKKVIVPVANAPSVLRGSGLLTGLKYVPEQNEDGEDLIMTEGVLPIGTNLSESSFMMRQYAENDGGVDTLDIPVTVRDGTFLGIVERAAGSSPGNFKVYDLRNNFQQFGSDVSLPTGFRVIWEEIAMSGSLLVVGSTNRGLKVFDFINGGQVGEDISF